MRRALQPAQRRVKQQSCLLGFILVQITISKLGYGPIQPLPCFYKVLLEHSIFCIAVDKSPQMLQLDAGTYHVTVLQFKVQILFIYVLSSCLHQAEVSVSLAAALLIWDPLKLTCCQQVISLVNGIIENPVFLLLLASSCSGLRKCPNLFATQPLWASL